MGLGIDIGVDAQADRRAPADLDGLRRQQVQLAQALDVEALHADLERAAQLVSLFADAGEHHLVGAPAGGQHAFELADRDDVETAPGAGKGLQHGQRRVGLHGVADQVRAAGKCTLVGGERAEHRLARVDVQRRAVRARQCLKAQVFDEELVAAPRDVRRTG